MEKPRIVGGHVALDLVNTIAPRPADDEAVDWLDSPAALMHWARRVDLVTAAEAGSVSTAWAATPASADQARHAATEIREALYAVLTAALGTHETTDGSAAAASGSRATATQNDAPTSGWHEAATQNDAPTSGWHEAASQNDAPTPGWHEAANQSDQPRSADGIAAALDRLMLRWSAATGRSALRPGGMGEPPAVLVVGSPGAMLIPDRLAHAAVDLVRTADLSQLRACPVAEGGCGWLFLDRSRNHSRRWCTMDDCGTHAKSRRLTSRRRTARIAQR